MKTKLLKYLFAAVLLLISNFSFAQEGSKNINAAKPDILDSLLAIAIILFILSVITEKLTQFFRKYSAAIPSKYKPAGIWENINSKDRTKEKDIEKEVMSLSMVIGILICLLFRVDMITMIRSTDDPRNTLYWQNGFLSGLFQNFTWLGITLSGLFLSFGSKFFHDLLDTLFQVKNLKRKLNENATYEVSSADQLTEYLSFSEPDLVRLAIAQNEQSLRTKFPNIAFLNDSIIVINGERRDVLGIYLSDNKTSGIPEKVPVKLPSGKIYQVATEVIAKLGRIKIQSGMEGSVAHEDSAGYTGSACCVFVDSEQRNLLLTNAHVLAAGSLNNSLFDTDKKNVLYNGQVIGTWYYAEMNQQGDFGLVNLNDDALEKITIPGFDKSSRDIVKDDWMKLSVNITGNRSKTVSGAVVIEMIKDQVEIEYRGGNFITLREALLIADIADKQNCKPITDFGDSGGSVYDSDNKLIGIITARDDKFTYAVPLKSFITNLQLEIKQLS